MKGVVQGDRRPISGAKLQLYVSGSTGDGSPSLLLVSKMFSTASDGAFAISGPYSCPTAASQVYLVATGGIPASFGGDNSSLALMADLGSCGEVQNLPFVTVNEFTTIGSVWPLAPFAKSSTQIGSASVDAQELSGTSELVNRFVSVVSGDAPGPLLAANEVAPIEKLDMLSNILAACVNSGGGTAGDGSACGQLFSAATSPGSPAPVDTLAALLAVAQNPGRNVVELFNLRPANPVFLPVLNAPPDDWTLPVSTVPSTPIIFPGTDTLAAGQAVSIIDSTPGASIYYTIDGSTPSPTSLPYVGPIPLTSSTTINAVAVRNSVSSSVASRIFKIVLPISIALTPLSSSLFASQTETFTATVVGSGNTAVTWSLSPAIGTMSATGFYLAPATVSSAQTVTVTATSLADPTKSASAAITLVPPLGIALIPNSATVSPNQTQAFSTIVSNGSNMAVTWTLSPTVGNISASGVYTAPASIGSAQTVTVTATSVANAGRSATAVLSLMPTVSVSVSPSSISLAPSQTRAFTATIANSPNTAVTWSLNPAVGNITSAGVYSAPASNTVAQSVTITATSVADSTKTASAAITLVPPVSVIVTPGSVTLGPSSSQAFSASVSNSSNTAVTWSLSPVVGSISAGGVYTAPSSVTTAQTVMVIATSAADSTKTAAASISLVPSISVVVTPGSVTLGPSSSQAFSASVSNSSNTAVTWSLSPAVGSISAGGVYTAPSLITTAQTVTVIATSAADSTKTAAASISLVPSIAVGLTPGSTALTQAQTQAFVATVTNASNTAVTWLLSPAIGSISAAGVYTAPASITTAQSVTVTVTSQQDPTKTTRASISLVPPVSVQLTPGTVTLSSSQTQSFAATVANSLNAAVTWSVSPAVGSITATGIYTAPASITTGQLVTVTATSLADVAKTASATISLVAAASVVLTPSSVTLAPSQTQTFTATVANSTNTAVTWSLNPAIGSISAGGVYTAPASNITAQTVKITATSVADLTKVASATISLPVSVSVTLTPGTVTLTSSQTAAFSASVANSSNSAVTWSITPAIGSISATGIYTAPATISNALTVAVIATSIADSSKTAGASVSLLPPVNVSVTPGTVVLTPSQTAAFSASVANSSNSAVTWSLTPAIGSISATGIYTAPATISNALTVTVIATSVADSSKTAVASMSLLPPVCVSVTPSTIALSLLQTQQFTATVTGTPDPSVSWSLSPNIGTISSGGLYTGPASFSGSASVTVTATSSAAKQSGSTTLASSCASSNLSATVSIDASYSSPITITRGGSYTGKWRSADPKVAAVTVVTDEPVIIHDSVVTGPGNLILANCNCQNGINVTVSNVLGIATNPNVVGQAKGNFVTVIGGTSVDVGQSTMTGVAAGIVVVNSTPTHLHIYNNISVNSDDRASNGNGGMLAARLGYGHVVILTNVSAPQGADISWNQFINTPGASSVEDMISVYDSQGGSPNDEIAVHDNYLQGAASTLGAGYTGGGIITDGYGASGGKVTAFVTIYNNEVVQTANYAFAIAAGHDVTIHNNRVVSSGTDSSGAWLGLAGFGSPVGLYLWNFYNSPYFYNNELIANTGGLVRPDATGNPIRSDIAVISPSLLLNNGASLNSFIGPLTDPTVPTLADERQEYTLWQAKLLSAGRSLGVTSSIQP